VPGSLPDALSTNGPPRIDSPPRKRFPRFRIGKNLLAGTIAKRSGRPRHVFSTVTTVLIALSIVPDVLAAAIIVPALAVRLPE
jgi:hypothetical protein